MTSQTESTTRKEASEAFKDFKARMMALLDDHYQVGMAAIAALQEENAALRQVNAALREKKEVWAQFAALEQEFAALQVHNASKTTSLAIVEAAPVVSIQQQVSKQTLVLPATKVRIVEDTKPALNPIQQRASQQLLLSLATKVRIVDFEETKAALEPIQRQASQQTSVSPATNLRIKDTKPALEPKVLNARKVAAAVRCFQPRTGPQGFTYVYISLGKNTQRSGVHYKLRNLGVDMARIVEIIYPARDVLGLRVHLQYLPIISERLAHHNITKIDKFDPRVTSYYARAFQPNDINGLKA
ncbi:hypothetical protein INT43_009016 [Umbelopsis isabellina]|uniref:Uncharacterized protein n=1 Tax=Mortierella isabellina TaxID=91625 RepID=A0A8H7PCW1_MORIS|nr:hypothetical protein INT43_009016 [Umbelopsis isabellina]